MPPTNVILSEISNQHAVFTCERGIVSVQFVNDTTAVGKPWSFSRLAACQFGSWVLETGNWGDFPFDGIDTATVRVLGSRLREFAISADRERAEGWPMRLRLFS
jgi:hypothetical protein